MPAWDACPGDDEKRRMLNGLAALEPFVHHPEITRRIVARLQYRDGYDDVCRLWLSGPAQRRSSARTRAWKRPRASADSLNRLS
jgi:hypothetical protein